MADTPQTGETATPGNVSNDVTSISAPAVDNTNTAEVQQLRKEAEQATIRANQLSNQLEERRKQDEAVKQKQLEEQAEFKTLYEQTQSRLNELETAAETREQNQKLATATEDVLKEYPSDVQDLAKTAGLSLSSDTDEARNSLKEKLDAFKAKVGTSSNTSASSSNPRPQPGTPTDRESLVARAYPGAESPMALAGARGDDSVALQYIKTLPAIQRMREIANAGQ